VCVEREEFVGVVGIDVSRTLAQRVRKNSGDKSFQIQSVLFCQNYFLLFSLLYFYLNLKRLIFEFQKMISNSLTSDYSF